MREFDLWALKSSMSLMPLLVLWVCSLGPSAQGAGPASALEPTRPKAAQGVQENTLPEKSPINKKKGHVRIATLGPRPLSVEAKADPQKIVEQVITHWRQEFSQVLADRLDLIAGRKHGMRSPPVHPGKEEGTRRRDRGLESSADELALVP